MNPCSSLKQKFDRSDRLDQSIEKSISINHKIQDDVKRNEFARDRDRILFTRAFRRLSHKTQIFTNEKGDHFRTRLTHTLEVSQIARSLAKYFSVDEDLTEAIALGHDIGHTPFGHQGEKVLDEIMCGNDNLGVIVIPINHGGFKHNYNSVRVLDVIQTKFENKSGLNLSWQVLEGILKHTRITRCEKSDCKECGKYWNIKRFINDNELIDRLFLEYEFSVTFEGQIVSIADEIAQRQHDIDDGLRGLHINIESLYKKVLEFADEIVKNSRSSHGIKTKSEKKHYDNCNDLLQVLINKLKNKSSDRLYKQESLVRNLIEYFILDVFETTKYNYNNLPKKRDCKILDRQIVSCSHCAKKLNTDLKKCIEKQIVNSYEINKFDGKTKYIIRQLFKAYYKNPLQMPHYVLRRLEHKIKQNSNLYPIKIKSNKRLKSKQLGDIKFKDGDKNDINSLIADLKLEKLDENKKEQLKLINEIELDSLKNENEILLKYLLENNYAYLSTICDYIAGMSDNYAKKEYEELYLVD